MHVPMTHTNLQPHTHHHTKTKQKQDTNRKLGIKWWETKTISRVRRNSCLWRFGSYFSSESFLKHLIRRIYIADFQTRTWLFLSFQKPKHSEGALQVGRPPCFKLLESPWGGSQQLERRGQTWIQGWSERLWAYGEPLPDSYETEGIRYWLASSSHSVVASCSGFVRATVNTEPSCK